MIDANFESDPNAAVMGTVMWSPRDVRWRHTRFDPVEISRAILTASQCQHSERQTNRACTRRAPDDRRLIDVHGVAGPMGGTGGSLRVGWMKLCATKDVHSRAK